MPQPTPFLPHPVYSVEDGTRPSVPRVFIAPQRYVQCPGALGHLDRYLGLLPGNQSLLLASAGALARHGDALVAHLGTADIKVTPTTFTGECSIEEIDRIVASAQSAESPADYLVALGGGKCIDTGKCVAHRLGIPVVIIPTLASNDAPCSALSVVYTPEGQTEGVEFFARVGLPVHLGQLGVSADARTDLELVADIALSFPMIANEPFAVTRESLLTALAGADALGREIADSAGDAAWRTLHSS